MPPKLSNDHELLVRIDERMKSNNERIEELKKLTASEHSVFRKELKDLRSHIRSDYVPRAEFDEFANDWRKMRWKLMSMGVVASASAAGLVIALGNF